MAQSLATFLTRYRDDLIVLLLIVAGIALNVSAPFWFTPPYFEYTIWLYLALLFAWIPVYALVRRGKRRPRWVVLAALVGALLTLFSCMLFRSMSAFGMALLMDNILCEQQPAETGQVRYTCIHDYFSSDSEPFDPTLVLSGPEWSPILFVMETDWWEGV